MRWTHERWNPEREVDPFPFAIHLAADRKLSLHHTSSFGCAKSEFDKSKLDAWTKAMTFFGSQQPFEEMPESIPFQRASSEAGLKHIAIFHRVNALHFSLRLVATLHFQKCG